MSAQPDKSHLRGYLVVFLLLCLLTAAEVGVVYVEGIARNLLISALLVLAVAKAGLVLMSYMHLSSEARALKWSIIVPLCLPALFAFVLMADAGWRLFR